VVPVIQPAGGAGYWFQDQWWRDGLGLAAFDHFNNLSSAIVFSFKKRVVIYFPANRTKDKHCATRFL